jgi:hypothetical protein
VTLDLSRITAASRVLVRAVDPRSGTAVTVGTFAVGEGPSVPALGSNSAGAGDWVLLLTPA